MLTLLVSVAACTRAKEEEASNADKYDPNDGFSLSNFIGTTKSPPDEFAVMTTRPLEMPQDFAALPQPNPGERSRLVPDPVAEARAVLLGDPAPQPATARISVSESALLSATGSAAAPNIRTVLDSEQAAASGAQEEYLIDELLPSLRASRGAGLADTIKPEEERVRLSTLAPAQETSGLATFSSAAPVAAVPQTAVTIPSALPAGPALPAVDPVTGTELIYIPE